MSMIGNNKEEPIIQDSTMLQPQTSAFQLSIRPDRIGVITINVLDEKVNQLKEAFIEEVVPLLKEAQETSGLQGLVMISGKPDSFIAGADIKMINACKSAQAAQQLATRGQELMAAIAALPFPAVAAIHGACLGGGLELVLACHARICSNDEKTVFALPEVKLGLLPGAGGTQRLPNLVGLPQALMMMLTGKQISAKQALRMGLVEDCVPQEILLDVAVEYIKSGRKKQQILPWQQRMWHSKLGQMVLFYKVRKETKAKTKGHYPALERIIQVVQQGCKQSKLGYAAEALAFGQLTMTPESIALRHLFFASRSLNKGVLLPAEDEGFSIQHVGILGGGFMGGGIANVTAMRANLPVRIKDINEESINTAIKYTWQILKKRIKSKRLKPAESQRQMLLLSGTTDYSSFRKMDIVIEAVFEDLALKQQMVADVEQYAHERTIFASNTSSLPIKQIAYGSKRPEHIIGLHYFSPVDKMPLVEVIPHAKTSPETLSTVLKFAKSQGKTAIVVGDKAGFYVNRILVPYITEAARCLLAGEPIESIDHALVAFGFPVGPLALLDEVGIDVGTKIIPILVEAFGERFALPSAFENIIKDGRKGRKNGKGFYIYPAKTTRWLAFKQKKQADNGIYPLLGVMPSARLSATHIAQRTVMMMLNEAARCLEEKVIHDPISGDIGAVFGFGFPPHLGGPFHYMDRMGIDKIIETMKGLQHDYGERFAPCAYLLRLQEEKRCFYE